jgi:A/G-specific adenine glycosylase
MPMVSEPSKEVIKIYQQRIVEFYDQYGRKDLPWRLTGNPWKILLAEMLLRKTTAKQVEPIYRILADKEIEELAGISQEKLEEILQPIGIYHERAKLIRSAARKVQSGAVKDLVNEKFLKSIKGAGPYTVNAVLCFSEGQKRPAMDSNMIRVMERVLDIASDKKRARTDRKLWKKAALLMPEENPKEYNWGVLDFAALICKSKKPKCDQCLMNDICVYYRTQFQGKNS